jgi:hypothetical protein
MKEYWAVLAECTKGSVLIIGDDRSCATRVASHCSVASWLIVFDKGLSRIATRASSRQFYRPGAAGFFVSSLSVSEDDERRV